MVGVDVLPLIRSQMSEVHGDNKRPPRLGLQTFERSAVAQQLMIPVILERQSSEEVVKAP